MIFGMGGRVRGCRRRWYVAGVVGLGLALALNWSSSTSGAEVEMGRLHNPIIPGFHPDPSVVRVGSDFYLVTSSFEYFPGVPLFHSRDLAHWEQLSHVLTRPSQLPLDHAGVSQGIFAPTIRYSAGTYYMITTNVSDGGNFYVTATDPAGPWSEPIWISEQGGIDPSLFFDDDGTVYLTTNGGPPGENGPPGIYQSKIDVKTGRLLSRPRHVWRGTGGRYPEGPHLYKIDGQYYLMISEGGTEYGHMVTIARSASPWGPFDVNPANPILTHRNTQNEQMIQGTGHAELVEDASGRWWMVFLAFRQVGGNFHHLGRETFIAPVRWDAEGWPIVNEREPVEMEIVVVGMEPSPVAALATREDFAGSLSVIWNYLRHPESARPSTSERRGWLTLRGSAATLRDAMRPGVSPTFVGRRQEHLRCRAATLLDFRPERDGDEAGLTLLQNGDHRYDLGVRRRGGRREVFVRQTIGPNLSTSTAQAALGSVDTVVLEVRAEPEEYTFWYKSDSGVPLRLGAARTRYLSSEVAGGFTGVYIGLYATGNGRESTTPAHFDWFDYEGR
jgi:xylan 1,4-beta-xylosidase